MLPDVSLRTVAREDVARLGAWLRDEEVSSKWFGHYACGDPVHRGYDPDRILEAADSEWDRVFRFDPHRFIFSVCDEFGDHVGEAQVLLDDGGGAELSLLIGRKDLWHRGYGTSTVITLLDEVFGHYGLDRAWVNVPEDNEAALGLFTKLGFLQLETRELCRRPDGASLYACILSMDAEDFAGSRPRRRDEGSMPVITIAGPPGSGSEVIGADIARIAGVRFVDAELPEGMCRRLGCSIGELDAFEANCRRWYGRLLNAFQGPWEQHSAYDGLYDGFSFQPLTDRYDYYEPQRHVTRERYVEALAGAVAEVSRAEPAVIHGRGSHLFVPAELPALHVFVSAPAHLRHRRVAAARGLGLDEAARWLKGAERDESAVFKHAIGVDPSDVAQYDLCLNLERLSIDRAAQTVAGVLVSAGMTNRKEGIVSRGS